MESSDFNIIEIDFAELNEIDQGELNEMKFSLVISICPSIPSFIPIFMILFCNVII